MNRLVRTRMPGGVAGASGEFPEPLCRFWRGLRLECASELGHPSPG
jgi:hypothetical protein